MKLEKLPLPSREIVEIKSENSEQDSNYYTVLIGANGVGKTRIFETIVSEYSQYGAKELSQERKSQFPEKIIFSTYTLFNRKLPYMFDKNLVYTTPFRSDKIISQVARLYFENQLDDNNEKIFPTLNRLQNLLDIVGLPKVSVSGLSSLPYPSIRSVSAALDRFIAEKLNLERSGYNDDELRGKIDNYDRYNDLLKLLKRRKEIIKNPEQVGDELIYDSKNQKLFYDHLDKMNGSEDGIYCYKSLLALKNMLIDYRRVLNLRNNVQNIYNLDELISIYKKYYLDINDYEAKELVRLDYKICDGLGVDFVNNLAFLKSEYMYATIDKFSSGQFAMFTRMMELVSAVKENSLVLIDEPETFLNPKWVFEFVSMLKDIFKNMNCHFIIASQSPFIVGSVKKEDIIKLKKESLGIVSAEYVETQTLGATFDDILSNVFGVSLEDNKVADDYISEINNKAKDDILEAFEMLPDLAESREKMNLVLRLSSPENKERIKAKIKELEERYFGEQRGHFNQRDT